WKDRFRRNFVVPARSGEGSFHYGLRTRIACVGPPWVSDLRPRESPEGKLNGGEGHEGGQGLGKIFHIVCETPVSSQPGERALDDPAARTISSSSGRARSARPGCGRTTMWGSAVSRFGSAASAACRSTI